MTHQVRDPQPGKDQTAAQSGHLDDRGMAKRPVGTLRLSLVLELPGFTHGKTVWPDHGRNQDPSNADRLWDPPYNTKSTA